MNPQQYQRVKELFLAACELDEGRGLDESRVAAFLDRECADDPQLRQEVESLLKHHLPTTIIGESPEDTPQGKILRPVPKRFLEAEAAGDGPKEERFSPGTVIAGRYRILGLLGRGGMGEVYRADDLKLNQPVALKFLSRLRTRDDAWLARFHSEVRLARRVTHLNVNRVYDIGEADGEAFISMEYVDGEDLASLLRRVGRLSGDKAVEIARQLCAGLGAAHDRGVLHRDLKPANVMIDGRGQVRITDFGIASLAAKASEENPLVGTPAFMAPELFQGKEPSVRTDIYSLGIVLYEVVTGHEPFEETSADRRGQDTSPNFAPLLSGNVEPRAGSRDRAVPGRGSAAPPRLDLCNRSRIARRRPVDRSAGGRRDAVAEYGGRDRHCPWPQTGSCLSDGRPFRNLRLRRFLALGDQRDPGSWSRARSDACWVGCRNTWLVRQFLDSDHSDHIGLFCMVSTRRQLHNLPD